MSSSLQTVTPECRHALCSILFRDGTAVNGIETFKQIGHPSFNIATILPDS